MDTTRFDAIARLLGARSSRRAALGFAAGLAASAGAARTAVAVQDTSPAADESVADDPAFLFVQTFAAGRLEPGAAAGSYALTLSGGADHTLYFSDRPARIVGTMPTTRFLDILGFSPADPPNAALLAATDGEDLTMVVELIDPVQNEAAGTLVYDVRILGEADVDMRVHTGPQAAPATGISFETTHLFIDGFACGTHEVGCYLNGARVGGIGKRGYHLSWDSGDIFGTCRPSAGCPALTDACNQTVPACGGACIAAQDRKGPDDCTSCAFPVDNLPTGCGNGGGGM